MNIFVGGEIIFAIFAKYRLFISSQGPKVDPEEQGAGNVMREATRGGRRFLCCR